MESAELDEYLDMALNLSDQCMSLKVPMVPWYHGRAMVPGGYPQTPAAENFFGAFGLKCPWHFWVKSLGEIFNIFDFAAEDLF